MTDNGKKADTAICTFDADSIMIRNESLVDNIMGNYSFTRLLLLQSLGKEPQDAQCALVDAVMVTIMEHGLVPSVVVSRLTHYGAPESFQGAVVAGLLGVGDRYAGTASECGALLERLLAAPEAERETRCAQEVAEYKRSGRPLPGFGHPIHRAVDPRVDKLLEVAQGIGVKGEYIRAMNLLKDTVHEATGKPLVINISAAMAAVMGEAGIPAALMRGIVLIARCAGLVGHLFEEMNNPIAHKLWEGAQAAAERKEQ